MRHKMAAKLKSDDKEQSKRFIETAHEVEADDESSTADAVMGKLAKQPPQPKKQHSQKT